MMRRAKTILILFVVTLTVAGQSIKPFEDGDRVTFVGNSITDGGHYHSFIWLYYMTRFPNKQITFYNAGIGGDRIVEMLKRFDADVLSKNPNKIILTFGMNDSGYAEYNSDNSGAFADKIVAESHHNYQQMERRLQTLSDIEISLLGSSPYDETVVKEVPQPYVSKNNAMKRIVDYQKRSAGTNGWGFFDFNEPMTALNIKLQRNNPSFSLCGPDRIHPDNDGHMVMAYLFLKAQGFANQSVARIGINTKNKKVLTSDNCLITNCTYSYDQIAFDYLSNALPYPLDTVPLTGEYKMRQSDALSVVPFMQEMNNEELKLTGLDKGAYDLFIDNVMIGTWTHEEFEKGINLAAITWTPQYQQALSIMCLNERRWQIERELREYIWIQFYFFEKRGLLFADNKAALDILDREIPNDIWLTGRRNKYAILMHSEVREAYMKQVDLLTSNIYKINKPETRRIRIERRTNSGKN